MQICKWQKSTGLKKPVMLFLCCMFSLPLLAGEKVDMAFSLRESGKIYVVVAALLIIFAGMVVYLINLDRKVSRIEEQQKSNRE